MGTLYLLRVYNKMKDLGLQGLELLNDFPVILSFKDTHKNTLRQKINHKIARDSKGLDRRVEARYEEAL